MDSGFFAKVGAEMPTPQSDGAIMTLLKQFIRSNPTLFTELLKESCGKRKTAVKNRIIVSRCRQRCDYARSRLSKKATPLKSKDFRHTAISSKPSRSVFRYGLLAFSDRRLLSLNLWYI
jgi:hypothetical protein